MKTRTAKFISTTAAAAVLVAPVVPGVASAAAVAPEDGLYIVNPETGAKLYFSLDDLFDQNSALIDAINDAGFDNVFVVQDGQDAVFNNLFDGQDFTEYEAGDIPSGEYVKPDGSKQPVEDVDAPAELKVESVSAITSTYVEVTFEALAEAVEGATVEVKDNKGNVVEVVAQDLAKGAKSAQFDFKAEYKADQEGVWTVNGAEYNFDAIAQLEDIIEAAAGSNQVKLLAALEAADIKNVNEDAIADYATAISTDTDINSLEDIQAIIDKVNEEAGEADAAASVVKTVADATTQPQLLKALQDNFERVNADWIVEYATTANAITLADGSQATLLGLNEDNYVGETKAASLKSIQAAIDGVNATAISTAAGNVAKSADQAKVTTLIQNYTVEDANGTKEAAIKLSQTKTTALKVTDATTVSALYNALTAAANDASISLKATDLNENNKATYLTDLNASTTRADLVTAIKAGTFTGIYTLVNTTNGDAITAAQTAVDTAAGNGVATDATKKAFTDALKALEKATAHLKGDAKFVYSNVDETKLADLASDVDGLGSVTATAINELLNTDATAAKLTAALKVINTDASTATQVKTALETFLTELVAAGNQSVVDAYLDLTTQAKLEVAALVIKARVDAGADFANNDAIFKAADGTGAIKTAIDGHDTQLDKFNAIGDLASATTSATKAALDSYANEEYAELTLAQKAAVAEEINKLTKDIPNANGVAVPTPLDFGGADAVKSFAEADAIISAAIAKVLAN